MIGRERWITESDRQNAKRSKNFCMAIVQAYKHYMVGIYVAVLI